MRPRSIARGALTWCLVLGAALADSGPPVPRAAAARPASPGRAPALAMRAGVGQAAVQRPVPTQAQASPMQSQAAPAPASAVPAADPFAATSWAPPVAAQPVAPVVAAATAVAALPAAPVEPSAPPLPFVYAGSYNDGSHRVVILLRGDQVLLLQQGDVVDSTYRVDRVAPGVVVMTYLPLQLRQTVPAADPV
jgi:hypothetical protein